MNKVNKIKSIMRKLEVIADELEFMGFEDNATHLDFIKHDLEYERQKIIGAEVVYLGDFWHSPEC